MILFSCKFIAQFFCSFFVGSCSCGNVFKPAKSNGFSVVHYLRSISTSRNLKMNSARTGFISFADLCVPCALCGVYLSQVFYSIVSRIAINVVNDFWRMSKVIKKNKSVEVLAASKNQNSNVWPLKVCARTFSGDGPASLPIKKVAIFVFKKCSQDLLRNFSAFSHTFPHVNVGKF